MMLAKYRRKMKAINFHTCQQVATMLRMPCETNPETLFQMLNAANHDQSDLVLCLLRINTKDSIRAAEKLVGKRIKHCPPVIHYQPPTVARHKSKDDRKVVYVTDKPVLRSGRRTWLKGFPMIRVGLSINQLVRRGVRRKEIRLAQKRGWVVLENA